MHFTPIITLLILSLGIFGSGPVIAQSSTSDLEIFQSCFLAPQAIQCADADFNNDGLINLQDFSLIRDAVRGDFNNDGFLDILVSGAKVWQGGGAGNWTEVSSGLYTSSGNSRQPKFADINNDNDQDVLVTGISSDQRSTKLYTNDGNGFFEEVINTTFDGLLGGTIIFADIDNYNDQDVLITGLHNVGFEVSF